MSQDVVRCVLLADRHHDLTEAVCGLLKTAFDAVVMVTDEPSLLESAKRLQPAVAVVDLSLAPGTSLDWVKQVRSLCPNLKIILLSVYDEPSVKRLAIEVGVDAFVLKRDIASDLLAAVDAVSNTERTTSVTK
jgi:DNA-binding NarL/FixJ family response regulator